jgi:dienelactone hydrolase
VALVVHGWLESIETPWVPDLLANLREYRGGCIIFMDYSNHSIVNDYFVLVRKFNPISSVLLRKLAQLDEQGFDPDKMFLYGFSFGAQLVIHAGMLFGSNRIAEIDGG